MVYMKNILSYITRKNAPYDWGSEIDKLLKIQIHNSLLNGWSIEDIILVTNFPYEHMGVKAMEVPDSVFCDVSPTATKVQVVLYLMDHGFIKEGEVYWHHDNDAFELDLITEDDARAELGNECLALTDYGVTTINPGRNLRWSTGTLFFTLESKDIFELIKNEVYKWKANEEVSLLGLLRSGRRPEIRLRIKKINITYNFATRKRNVGETWKMTRKPLKVIHFHPTDERSVWKGYANMDIVRGRNPMGVRLLNDQLEELFKLYEIA